MVTEQRRSAFILRIAPRGIDPVPKEGFDRVPEALEMGHLIIGWARAEGLLNPDLDRNSFRKIIHDEYHRGAETFHGAGRDAGKMWLFIREMKRGDLVVVPAGPVFYVGEVACDEAFYDKTKREEDSAYRRSVKWLNNGQAIPRTAVAGSALASRMTARSTCVRAENLVDEIEACLNAASR